MQSFDWNLFWSGFGAIGSTIGSIVTAIAVFIAIKQLKQPKNKKVIIKYFMKEDFPLDDDPTFHIMMINDCLSSVFIESVGYVFNNKYVQLLNASTNKFVSINANSTIKPEAYNFPYTLKVDHYLDIEFDYENLCNNFKKEDKNKKIYFICKDSLKNTYKSKKITIEDFLDLYDETMDYSDVYLDP